MAKFEKIPSSDWLKIDPSDMPEHLKRLYAKKQAADAAAKAEKEAFEIAFSADLVKAGKLPTGRQARLGYNFGQLSLADPSKHSIVVANKAANKVVNFATLLGPDKRAK